VIKGHRQPVGGAGCGWAGQEAITKTLTEIWDPVAGRQPLARIGRRTCTSLLADKLQEPVVVAISAADQLVRYAPLNCAALLPEVGRFKREFRPATGFAELADPARQIQR